MRVQNSPKIHWGISRDWGIPYERGISYDQRILYDQGISYDQGIPYDWGNSYDRGISSAGAKFPNDLPREFCYAGTTNFPEVSVS